MSRDTLVTINADNSVLEASNDGGTTWAEIPFIGDISASPGSTPENDIIAFSGVGKVRGKPRVPSLSVTVPAYVPVIPVWDTLRTAGQASNFILFRLTTAERLIASGSDGKSEIAITSSSGVVTASGTDKIDFDDDEYNVGLVIKDTGNSKNYVLASFDSNDAPVVDPKPATNLAATHEFKIVIPSLRIQFNGQPSDPNENFAMPAEGALNTNFDITLRSVLPNWAIV